MAIPEDIADLWSEFPLQLKIEPLDDLFESDSISTNELKAFDDYLSDDYLSEPDAVVPDAFFEQVKAEKPQKLQKPLKPQERKGTAKKAVEVVGSDNAVMNGIYDNASTKLYAFEDFYTFLARENGLDRERLSILVDGVAPRPDEDFVAFLARSNGFDDEQVIDRLRQALSLEPVIDFSSGIKPNRPVKMEADLDLKVREGEDAASFFVRAGTWESASAIQEELAAAGLDENEDAESFFIRTETESSGYNYPDGGGGGALLPGAASVALIGTAFPKQEEEGGDLAKEQTSVLVSGTSSASSESSNDNQVVVKKRKSSDE